MDFWRRAFRRAKGRPALRRAILRVMPPPTVTVGGLRFRLHPRDNFTEREMWLKGRVPEPKSLTRLEGMVAGRDVLVLDVGANAGAFSVPLARALGPGGQVIALEPNPVMAGRLRRNLALNGLADRVDLRQAALGPENGTATLTLHARNFGGSSLAEVDRPGRKLTVPTLPLAALVAEAAGRPVLMKIDIEGYEDVALWPALEGPAEPLPDHILMETAHAAKWRHDLVGRLTALGYRAAFRGEGNTLFSRQGREAAA